MRAADGSAADGSAAAEVDLWGSPIPAVTGGGLGFFTYLAILFYFGTSLPQNKGGQGGVGARSSSSENQQQPPQQQRVPGETRYIQIGGRTRY